MMTSALERLAAHLQGNLPALLDDLRALVEMESPTYDKARLDHVQDFVSGRLAWAGAQVERQVQPAAGDHLLARWPAAEGGRPGQLLIIGHVDTVWPVGELARRPLRQEDGFLYGPGAFDMKAGVLMVVYAVQALRELELPLKRDVTFLVNTDEETGSLTSRPLIEAQARRSYAALIAEPAFADGCLTVARKGVGRFVVRVAGKAAHAGRNPQDGANAIEELAYQVLYLQSLNDHAQGITVNVGVAQGGTRPNVVPAEARAEVDLRIVHSDQAAGVVSAIRGLSPRLAGTQIEVEGGLTRPPWELNTACEALFHRARAVGLALGMQLDKRLSGGGSDGNFTAALGVPTVDGLGPEGAGAHASDERVKIDSLAPRMALLAGLILDLANNGA